MKTKLLLTTILTITWLSIKAQMLIQPWVQQGGNINGFVYDLHEFNGLLFVGGRFDSIGVLPVNNLATWDGSQYNSINATFGDSTGFGDVKVINVFNNNLIVGGNFTSVNSISANHIAQWDGSSWSAFGNGLDGPIADLLIFNNELYAVGAFKMNGYGALAAKWNGTTWEQIGPITWLNGTYYVQSIKDYKNEIYIGGGLWTFSYKGIKKFDGFDWVAPGDGIVGMCDGFGCSAPAMEVYNNELFLGGDFDDMTNSSINNIAKWDSLNWNSFYGTSNFVVNAIKEFNSELYFAGRYSFSSSENIAKWDGMDFQYYDSIYPTIRALEVYNGEIYAGGDGVLLKLENPTGVTNNGDDFMKLKMYPNPFNETLTLEIKNARHNFPLYFTLSDPLGRIVKEIRNVQKEKFEINRQGLYDGIYFYQIKDSKGNFINGKIVIQ